MKEIAEKIWAVLKSSWTIGVLVFVAVAGLIVRWLRVKPPPFRPEPRTVSFDPERAELERERIRDHADARADEVRREADRARTSVADKFGDSS